MNKGVNSFIIKSSASGGSVTQYQEDAAHVSGNKGTGALVVRKDTAASLCGTDGDYTFLLVDANGKLHVTGTGGSQYAEDIAHVTGDLGNGALVVRKDTAASLCDTDGDYTFLQVDANGKLYVTGTGGSQYAEDVAHVTGALGNIALVVRKDAAASLCGTDGDYTALLVDANGRLHVLDKNSDAMLTALQLIDNAIAGNEMQVDLASSIPAGANKIGEIDIDDISGGTQTNDVKVTLDTEQVNIADISKGTQTNDVKVTLDSEDINVADISKGVQTNDVKVTLDTEQVNIADISKGTQTNDIKITLDSEEVTAICKKGDSNYTKFHKDDQQTTAQTDTILWNPTAGKKFVVTDIVISVDTAMTVHIEDATTKIFEFYLAANGGVVMNLQTPYQSILADNDLTYTSSTAGKISIEVLGYEV